MSTSRVQASRATRRDRKTGSQALTDTYSEFIAGIELEHLWLAELEVHNHHGPTTPPAGNVRVEDDATWEARDGGFRIYHMYNVVFLAASDAETPLATLRATYGLEFSSGMPLTEELFTIFSTVNVPVNTWPYLRELVASTLGRFGWQPFALPTMKRLPRRSSRRRSSRGTRADRPEASS